MIYSLQEWTENKELSAAARVLEKRAQETFERVLAGCKLIDPERRYKIINAIAENLKLAEMALDGGGQQ